MTKITKEIIDKVNNSVDSWNHGIFKEPFGIPSTIKEPVIYMRHETGGVSGGSCWDTSNPTYYSSKEEIPNFQALDLLLEYLCPNITYLTYKKIDALIESNEEIEWEYYGNRTDYLIKFIRLSKMESFLESLTN